MKKFKKLLAVLLIVAAVCALTAVPASAASASGNGNGDGFNWSSSLTLNSTSQLREWWSQRSLQVLRLHIFAQR